MTPPALQLLDISKRFGNVEALSRVSFTLERGEVHALLGENGAGKSTLMRIGFGLVQPDAGTILVDGAPTVLRDPTAARRRGIGMVHQHFTAIPAFTVAENIGLAAGWRVRPRELAGRVTALAADSGLPLDPGAIAGELSAGLKQRLEVLKALAADARVLLLDEPTSVLAPAEAEALLALVRRFQERGVATVLITHKLEEALRAADRVTVLRRGAVAFSGPVAGVTADALAGHMLGEAPPVRSRTAPQPPGEMRLQADGLAVPRLEHGGSGLRSATFAVCAGEVVGVAAVEGNGQRELLRAIAGLAEPAAGRLRVDRPLSFVPEDRTSEALIGQFTLVENLALSQGRSAPWVRGPWIDWKRATRRTEELLQRFAVRASGPEARAASLSGGNQQRLVIAGALERRPTVLVAENPTRGLDLRATAEVYQRLRAAAASGVAVLVHLADLDELLELADRIVVLAGGVLSEVPPGASRDEIGRRMLGVGGAESGR
jgi:simple sugar transport system ATP-binding protein